MIELEAALRLRARELLGQGLISCFIGWEPTRWADRVRPKFAFIPAQADDLVYNEHCLNLLAKCTLNLPDSLEVVGLATRGCEARALNRLIADGRLRRERVYLLGLPCTGMWENGQTAAKCALCRHRNPVIYDELLGEAVAEAEPTQRFAAVRELEELPAEARYAYWQRQFSRCIRCYACRNACPACNCRECYVGDQRGGWQGKRTDAQQNLLFGLTRAFHISDRCIECGECERVCPMRLPLMKLSRKLVKEAAELFGGEEAGLSALAVPALATYDQADPEEFL